MTVAYSSQPWLPFRKPNVAARLRLFCFPYAGGGAHAFRSWQAALPPYVEVCAVQPPGHGTHLHQRPFTRIGSLVQAASEALLPLLDMPFAFFGHSMGALLSYELAQHLRGAHSIEPQRLFASGSPAPQFADNREPIYGLPHDEFIEELRRLGGTPREVLENEELLELMLPMLRADFEVVDTFTHSERPPLGCPITVFGGLRDEEASREDLEGWRAHTNAEFSVRMLDGDHFFLHEFETLLLQYIYIEITKLAGSQPARTDGLAITNS
jgi:medium-chain acyl-[acyl-carrier-protein] hydrolase